MDSPDMSKMIMTELKDALKLQEDALHDATHDPHYSTKVRGLYISSKLNYIRGHVTVAREDPEDNKLYPEWDSTWDAVWQPDDRIVDLHAKVATRVPGVTIVNEELDSSLWILYEPPKGRGSVLEVRPFGDDERKSLDISRKSDPLHLHDDTVQVGEPEDESAVDSDNTDTHAERALETEAEDMTDAAEVFLYVREHRGGNGKLMINATRNTIHLVTKDGDKTVEAEIGETSRIQYYPFVTGTAFRFINCGLQSSFVEVEGDKKVRDRRQDKEIFAILPPTSLDPNYGKYSRDGGKVYLVYDKAKAQHNDKCLSEFLEQLDTVVGLEKVKECDGKEKPSDVEIAQG